MAKADEREIGDRMVALMPRLHRFALALTASRSDADDLVQTTLERAIQRLDSWQRGSALDSWLFKIAHNLHRNERRDRATRLRLVTQHGETLESTDDGAHRAEAATELAEVRRRMLALPEEQRAVLMLVAVEGFSYQEAAGMLDVPIGTVTSRLGRARDALRAALSGKDHEMEPAR